MSKQADADIIDHMLEAIDVGDSIAAGGRPAFDADPQRQFAADTVVSRLGECGDKLSDAAVAAMPEIPWRAMKGMRNRLQHASLNIDYDLVWNVLTKELAGIRSVLEQHRAEFS